MPIQTDAIVGHTPGPWRVIGDTDILALEGTPSSIVVASTKFFEGPPTSWERANAALIAAAPDGLEAARFALSVLRANPVELSERMAIERLEAFIAKATGAQP